MPQPGRVNAPDSFESEEWARALDVVLADKAKHTQVFQPLVDLQRGVVAGYETLTRFSGPPDATPDKWFGAAKVHGKSAPLEASVARAALAYRRLLPENTFLTFNVTPQVLLDDEMQSTLFSAGGLAPIVIELTEQSEFEDFDNLALVLDELRAMGALVAIDDAGAGYAGLQALLVLKPNFIKLDRSLIAGIDSDPSKLALVEMLGSFVGRVDGWLVAEGIETLEELESLIRLGVPIGQGYLLGKPHAQMMQLPELMSEHIKRQSSLRESAVASVAGLVERTPSVTLKDSDVQAKEVFQVDKRVRWIPVLDEWNRPAGAIVPTTSGIETRNERPQIVKATSSVTDVARRALTRGSETRFDPLPCCDSQGHFVGVVRVERLIEKLSELARDNEPTEPS